MATLLGETLPRARHDRHRCEVCAGRIQPGDRYVNQRVAGDGRVWTYKAHPFCHRLYWHAARDFGIWAEEDILQMDSLIEYYAGALSALMSLFVPAPYPDSDELYEARDGAL